MNTTKTRPANYIGKCFNGHPMRVTGEQVMENRRVRRDGDYFRCDCGRLALVKAVKATYKPSVICDARCVGATRAVCDCSCGGDNHGGAHA